MAFFDKALIKVLAHEGGYVNHPDDPGGETYCGISRKNHPEWLGWSVVDSCANKKVFPQEIGDAVAGFYKENYWKKIYGDAFPQKIAEELFDCAVNCGTSKAVKMFQESLNLFNRDEQSHPLLVVDGVLGAATIEAYAEVSMGVTESDIVVCLKVLRVEHYINICRNKPSQRVFLRGWLKRVF